MFRSLLCTLWQKRPQTRRQSFQKIAVAVPPKDFSHEILRSWNVRHLSWFKDSVRQFFGCKNRLKRLWGILLAWHWVLLANVGYLQIASDQGTKCLWLWAFVVLDGFVFLDGGGMLWSSHIAQGRTGLNLQEQLQPKPRVGWLKPVMQLQHLALQIGKYCGDLRFRCFWKRCNMSRLVMTVSSFQAEAPALLVSWTSGRGSLSLLWAASERGEIIWFSSQVRGLLSPARHPTLSRN